MGLGNRIYTLRSGLGLSQGALAEKLGVSRQAVSKWENDSAVPELEKLVQLAEIFGVTLDQLAAGEALPKASVPQPETSGAAIPFSPNQIAALLLFSVGAAGGLLLYQADHLHRIVFAVLPCLACGLLCLWTRRGPALWCSWAVYLILDILISDREQLNWWSLFESRHGIYRFQRYELIPWLQLLGVFMVLAVTLRHFWRNPMRISNHLRRCLMIAAWVAGCAAWVGLQALRLQVDRINLQTAEEWSARFGADNWQRFLHFVRAGYYLSERRGQVWVCLLAAALVLTFTRTEPKAPPSEKQSLGERIYALRTAFNLSQGELADRLDISRQSVSKWETGNAVPELEKLLALSRLFGVPLEQLVKKELPARRTVTVLPWGQIAGIGLLLWGVFEMFRWAEFFEHSIGLFVPLLLLCSGAICLYWPGHAGLWCAWTAVLFFEAVVQGEVYDAASRLLLLRTESYSVSRCLFMLALQIVLVLLTLYAFRHKEFPRTHQTIPRLAGSWCLWVLLEALIDLRIYPGTSPVRFQSYIGYSMSGIVFRIVMDDLSLIALTALLVVTIAFIRAFRIQKEELA